MDFVVEPSHRLSGQLEIPGDKSISHRSIMLGALAEGVTEISGFLPGEDCLATLAAFRAMGVFIEHPEAQRVSVRGVGLRGLQAPTQTLDMGNSGTAMRLLTGLLAGQRFDSVLSGDASLNRRPMRRIVEPLSRMGALIDTSADGTAPLTIHGQQTLRGIDYALPVASAQVKSSLLLAGLYAQGETCVSEPAPTRDHSERMLAGFGYPVKRRGGRVCVNGPKSWQARSIVVPADLSSAAFFLVAASIAEQADLSLSDVGVNPTRTGVIDILRRMGGDIELSREREIGGEPLADIRVRASRLRGIRIPEDRVPLAIDEFPAIFIAAACAEGETLLSGARELRVKESDRIQAMADGLQALGVRAQPRPDGILIQGGSKRPFAGGEVHSHGDHRIAMAFAVAGWRAQDTIRIRDCANVATSFPGFVERAQAIGLDIKAAA